MDLTSPWQGRTDAGTKDGPASADVATGGSGGSARPDAALGGSGGGAAPDGAATGGTDGLPRTGGTGGSATDGAAGNVALDAGAVADGASSRDGGIDVPFSGDTNLPVDQGTGGSRTDGAMTGGTGGSRTGGSTTGGAGGTATGGTGGTDAGTKADAISSGDGKIDVPFFGDTRLPSDPGAGGSDGAGTGGTGGTGGVATGGTATGGTATGGTATGGVATGGTATGGTATGGTATGGTATGGTATGGTATGGTATGGTATGGTATGGTATGGTATGGTATGGTATGGTATGGTATGGATGPMIISIDFVGGGPAGNTGTVAMDPNEVAGVTPASHWNSAPGSAGSLEQLVLADGTPTSSAHVDWNASATYSAYFTDAPGDARMMNGYLDPPLTTSPARVNVTGLPSPMSSGYDVYVYCYGSIPSGRTRTYQYAIGTTIRTWTQQGPSATTFPGYNLAPEGGTGNNYDYVRFQNVTGSTFTLTATPVSATGGTSVRAPVNGIQIVYPAGS